MLRGRRKLRSTMIGLLLLLMSFTIASVSAYVYERAQQTITQTIKEIATLTLQNSALGDIEEGQTIHYTPSNQPDLDNIISVTTTKANVYLHLDSNLDAQKANYDTYDVVVKFDTVPVASAHSSGDTACKLKIPSPDYSSINLDVAGDWTFNFEIATTPESVNSDTVTTLTITVTAESTP